jgi:hypothetical protein
LTLEAQIEPQNISNSTVAEVLPPKLKIAPWNPGTSELAAAKRDYQVVLKVKGNIFCRHCPCAGKHLPGFEEICGVFGLAHNLI